MEPNVEVPANDFGDTGTGPQAVGPTVSLSALAEQTVQSLQLFGGQAWRRAELGLGRQAVRLAGRSQPTVHGHAIHADNARDCLGALAPTNSVHGLPAAAFKFCRSSKWSTHNKLEGRIKKTIHCWRSWQ
jgi:hypothetical protein